MTRNAAWWCWLLAAGFVLGTPPVAAEGILGVEVEGNSLKAAIRLPGDVGADLTVSFERVVGLSAANLGLSARLLDAADLALLAARLPSGLVSVPAGLPVLVTLEPPESGGLSFAGLATIELYTHNLGYLPGCPFRMFKAPLGGAFTDVTDANSGGSYRVRGHSGDFSELLIVADLRAVDDVIVVKFSQTRGKLAAHAGAIEPVVFGTLHALLDQAEAAYASGRTVRAVSRVEAFAAAVKQASGSDVPDVWRSSRDLANAAGELRAAASTLRFSLLLKSNAL